MRIKAKVNQILVDTNAVYPRLEITISLEQYEREISYLLLHMGTLKIIDHEKTLCKIYPDKNSLTLSKSPSEKTVYYFADLDYYRLERIERIRDNSDVHFIVDLSISEIIPTPKFSVEPCSVDIQYPIHNYYEIPKSKWVEEYLRDLQYKYVRMVELPLIPAPPEELKESVSSIDKAWKDYSVGEYQDVLDKCGKALEPISNFVKKKGYVKKEKKNGEERDVPDWKKLLEGSDTLAEAFEKIFKGIWGFNAPGSHTGTVISKAEAELALMVTYAIVNYVIRYFSKA